MRARNQRWPLVFHGSRWVFGTFTALVASAAVAEDQAGFKEFRLRAMTAEAKTLLSELHTGEKLFDADHDHFTTDLGSLDLVAECRRYAIGFVKPSHEADGKTRPGRMMKDVSGVSDLSAKKPPASWTKWCPDCTVEAKGFRALAVGNLGTPEQPVWDVWTIDEQRTLKHIVDGTRAPPR
jgi:hypothetical protein